METHVPAATFATRDAAAETGQLPGRRLLDERVEFGAAPPQADLDCDKLLRIICCLVSDATT